jgi:hypothetical protein
MPRLDWSKIGERFYEAGVDRGVLFIGDEPGVSWSGLTSVKEAHSGGDNKAHYIDGVKYAQRRGFEEFEATIEAYTYPPEFDVCNGVRSFGNGLFATQQRRKPFGFSYRSRIGNDTEGIDHAYKIHVVYNAMTEPSDQEHTSISDSVEPFNFSWKVTTKPPVLDFRPTAHFVIDSRIISDGLLTFIEDILYGTDEQMSRLPSAGELVHLFTTFEMPAFDAGDPNDVYYYTYDGGTPTAVQTETVDGGGA